MDRIATLLYFALIGAVVFLAKRKGREPFPWFVYASCLGPIAFIHALLLKPGDEIKKRGSFHDFVIGFFGAAMAGGLYLWGLMGIFGTPEGVRLYGQPTHIWGRGIVVVIAGLAGAALQRKKHPPQALGFLIAAGLYGLSMIAAAFTHG